MGRFTKLIDLNFHTHSIGGRGSRSVVIHGRLPRREEDAFIKVQKFLSKLDELGREFSQRPMIVFIRSQGGDKDSMDLLYEHLVYRIHSPLYTVTDFAASGSAVLFIGGDKGHRYLLGEDARLMLHGCKVLIEYKPIKWWQLLNHIWVVIKTKWGTQKRKKIVDQKIARMIWSLTGHNKTMLNRLDDWNDEEDEEKILSAMTRLLKEDQYFTPREAIACGLADEIIDKGRLKELIKGANEAN